MLGSVSSGYQCLRRQCPYIIFSFFIQRNFLASHLHNIVDEYMLNTRFVVSGVLYLVKCTNVHANFTSKFSLFHNLLAVTCSCPHTFTHSTIRASGCCPTGESWTSSNFLSSCSFLTDVPMIAPAAGSSLIQAPSSLPTCVCASHFF